ncbi:ATP-binding protein [Flavimarina sp. Hel_I_48]|uniref:sensor histidine kinase n=1 Tax=Flavimarina sp. Hel_I_48 TaxID=1392488 RepID=UPI0004DF7837|nr:ATP-binding protein [Flavimarina sp. Hel_I_48]
MSTKILKYYLPLLSLSLILAVWIFFNERNNNAKLELKDLSSKKKLIVEALNPVIANIYYWSHYDFIKEDFEVNYNGTFKEEMGNFIVGMNQYVQFRLLNTSGKEVLRLVRKDDGTIAYDRTLQDKRQRDYFKKTIKLDSSQIYFSPLNLNIEFGKIEVPYKPMIRGSAPVYSNKREKLGIVVINFQASKLLESLNYDLSSNFYILDKYGNYLANTSDATKEFQHILNRKNKNNFRYEHPVAWSAIETSQDSIITDFKGTWVIDRLDYKKSISKTSLINGTYAKVITDNEWYLVSRISNAYIFNSAKDYYIALMAINLLIVLIIIYVAKRELKTEALKNQYLLDLKENKILLEKQNKTLKFTKKKLQVRNRQLKEYNNIVAHNLRAPTTSMSALVSMLSGSKDLEEMDTYIPKLNKITESINSLVEDLLIYVRILNNNEVNTEKFDIETIIEDSETLFLEIIDEEVTVCLDTKAWHKLKFSKVYFQSVIQNLISNSIKYRDPNKECFIHIRTEYREDKKVLIVEDNGIGIDMEKYQNDIFKLYKRFHRNISGKGLGLFLVKTQLESLNAEIRVDSQLGKGTSFEIVFNKKH